MTVINTTTEREALRTRISSKTNLHVEESKCALMAVLALCAVKIGTTRMPLSSVDNWTSHPMVRISIIPYYSKGMLDIYLGDFAVLYSQVLLQSILPHFFRVKPYQ